jgi:hypothetical protein
MKSPLETGSPNEHEGTDDSGEASIKKSAENRESESAADDGEAPKLITNSRYHKQRQIEAVYHGYESI